MRKIVKFVYLFTVLGSPLVLASSALAASADVTSIETFMRSIIQICAGFAGLVATGVFVYGGFIYITSSGSPVHLQKAKNTLMFAAVGLAITIAAFVLSNIVTSVAASAFGS